MREYIWLPETEIAPTAAARAPIDRPVSVVDGVGGASPPLYYVHTDHLNRPIKMSDGSKTMVWSSEYQPWGAVQSLSGPLTLDLRFPGQWFQLEAGLHYNWHRHYDPSLGRYTQTDPLGFVDGPSVYGYARGNPYRYVDRDGRALKDLNNPIICETLREAVRFYCKSWPYSIFSTEKCHRGDDCVTLQNKIRKRRNCIKHQTLLTNICYPDDPSHEKRYQNESDAITRCQLLAIEKGCNLCLPEFKP